MQDIRLQGLTTSVPQRNVLQPDHCYRSAAAMARPLASPSEYLNQTITIGVPQLDRHRQSASPPSEFLKTTTIRALSLVPQPDHHHWSYCLNNVAVEQWRHVSDLQSMTEKALGEASHGNRQRKNSMQSHSKRNFIVVEP